MKSFDEWLQQSPIEPELPEGVCKAMKGSLWPFLFLCRECGCWYPMKWELSEDNFESHYCGKYGCCSLEQTNMRVPGKHGLIQRPLGSKNHYLHCQSCHRYFKYEEGALVTANCPRCRDHYAMMHESCAKDVKESFREVLPGLEKYGLLDEAPPKQQTATEVYNEQRAKRLEAMRQEAIEKYRAKSVGDSNG